MSLIVETDFMGVPMELEIKEGGYKISAENLKAKIESGEIIDLGNGKIKVPLATIKKYGNNLIRGLE